MKFDAIVVGAGPAGCTAAYHLARMGFKVLVIERGRIPGSKNVYGGRVYAGALSRVYPGFEREAPIERWVRVEKLSFSCGEDYVTLEARCGEKSFTAYLSRLCEWMAGKAESEGAVIATEVTVDELVREDGFYRGVRAGGEKVYADVVIDAEGINRILLEKTGLAGKLEPETVALGVKEVIKLDSEKIEERFGLEENEGLAWLSIGEDLTMGIPGGAFLYTFKDSVSLGAILFLDKALSMLKKPVYQVIDSLRLHRLFRRIVGDGRLIEYAAHLTPHYPEKLIPKRLCDNGLVIVGDAAGFLVDMAYTVRGVDLAVYSGYLAAKAVEKAHAQGSMSRENLMVYEDMVRESFIMKEIMKFRGARDVVRSEELMKMYPRILCRVLSRLYSIDLEAPKAVDALKSECGGLTGILSLALKAYGVMKKI